MTTSRPCGTEGLGQTGCKKNKFPSAVSAAGNSRWAAQTIHGIGGSKTDASDAPLVSGAPDP